MTKAKGYQIARQASLKSDFHRCHTGAVAIYNNKILALGWNSERLSLMQARYNKLRGFDGYSNKSSIHAEMMVINKIKYLDIDFSQVRLFVWRGKNEPLISKPCAACEKAIRDLGIKKVFYTGNNSYIEEIYNKF
jgi:deoxycytidylate deaminase